MFDHFVRSSLESLSTLLRAEVIGLAQIRDTGFGRRHVDLHATNGVFHLGHGYASFLIATSGDHYQADEWGMVSVIC